jgi:hypothetical protein
LILSQLDFANPDFDAGIFTDCDGVRDDHPYVTRRSTMCSSLVISESVLRVSARVDKQDLLPCPPSCFWCKRKKRHTVLELF